MIRGNGEGRAITGRLLPRLILAAGVAAGRVVRASECDWRQEPAMKPKMAASASPIPLALGGREIWRPSRAAITELHRCADPKSVDCVRTVMERHGASAQAFEFYRQTGWFLSKLKETGGPVMLASVVNPWRANENEQPALLGGNPAVVYPEEVQVSLEDDAGFQALKANFPRLMFWKSGPTLATSNMTSAGQSFVFRYRLLDGCHACAVRGWARIEFDFARDGTYHGAKVLDVSRRSE